MKKLVLALACVALFSLPARAAEMTVSGAASLTNAFTELKTLFEKSHAGLTVHVNFAASNPLLKQIQEGAPVDVFASADQATMDKAVASKVVDPATRKNFAQNDLVLIVPAGAKKPAKLEAIKAYKRVAVGNPASVPAGRYAKAALTTAKLWDALQSQLILGNSVRQVLDYVARGEVDAGLVYATDAKQLASKVDVAMVVGGHEPVSYPIAVATTGKNPKMGQEFLNFVLSPEGQKVLAKYGFSKP
ncbi:molybdate ABC transporter substrate-binding protein [Desulfovibrio legallii]|jgi:molybdate transport system substrate-binding protein|uniref:Molybdate transport system substrate-binding protein n=1 Tax=Desulfovibrio legallii TaxID=571438 RepID=A0A1G7NIH6_9BACT|nr:molybdate ABC transporter substrate-binding protein [Desulfovibrio legallii]SDF73050.1 molybdate transport system substrate-binding protein [Desulfovibrio legallii]